MTVIDKITLICQLVHNGTSVTGICEQVGSSKSALYRFAHDHGLRLSNKRLVDEPEKIKALLSSGLTQMEIGRRLNINRASVRYWAKHYGGMRHKKKCALFECGREFQSRNPNATCCCCNHLNRHLTRRGTVVEWKSCTLPECNNSFISVGGHKKWCSKDHHELHRRRIKNGIYDRIQGLCPQERCVVCGEDVVLDEHHTNVHRNKSDKSGPTSWLCPTHHMKIHRGLAKFVDGKFVDIVPLIRSVLKANAVSKQLRS